MEGRNEGVLVKFGDLGEVNFDVNCPEMRGNKAGDGRYTALQLVVYLPFR